MTAMCYKVTHYQYKDRIGNLKAEAVGVVSGEKHFPIFPGNMIFKPLTKSKPFSTPLYAYAEVFWSTVINKYFMPAPQYELATCEGYEEMRNILIMEPQFLWHIKKESPFRIFWSFSGNIRIKKST